MARCAVAEISDGGDAAAAAWPAAGGAGVSWSSVTLPCCSEYSSWEAGCAAGLLNASRLRSIGKGHQERVSRAGLLHSVWGQHHYLGVARPAKTGYSHSVAQRREELISRDLRILRRRAGIESVDIQSGAAHGQDVLSHGALALSVILGAGLSPESGPIRSGLL